MGVKGLAALASKGMNPTSSMISDLGRRRRLSSGPKHAGSAQLSTRLAACPFLIAFFRAPTWPTHALNSATHMEEPRPP